jgi:hypothetical protein
LGEVKDVQKNWEELDEYQKTERVTLSQDLNLKELKTDAIPLKVKDTHISYLVNSQTSASFSPLYIRSYHEM